MKMVSLRSLAFIAGLVLASANWTAAPGIASADDKSPKTGQPVIGEGKLPESPAESASEAAETKASASENSEEAEDSSKSRKTKRGKKSKKGDEKSQDEKDGKTAETTPPLTPAEEAALSAVAERAKILKATPTPFNSQLDESTSSENGLSNLSIRSGSSIRSSLAQRLVPNARVYFPGKLVIGKPTEFVLKGRPGSHAAIAMADKDSGAKPLFGQKIRLGADRKLVAAGIIPETGVLTLVVDMPIQGDLIGLPVFFETVIWQKPDFSDLVVASPVKSESAQEIADKANAIIVSGEKEQKRGLRFAPDSGVPLYQRGNEVLESGRL